MFPVKYKVSSLPIIIAYYVYPILGIIFFLFQFKGGSIRDMLWLIPALFLVLPRRYVESSFKFKKKIATVLFICLFVVFFKFIFSFLIANLGNFYIRPYLIELKGWLFLFLSIAWIQKFGQIPLSTFKKGAYFLSILYILFFILLVITGNYYRFGLGSESNYDGILILLGYILCLNEKRFDRTKIVLSVATLITLSKTGILAWLIVTLLRYRRDKRFILIFLPITLIFVAFVLLDQRGINNVSSLNNIDRIIFWAQGIQVIKEMSITQLLFGLFPGIPIDMETIIPGFDWYIGHFEELNFIKGAHAFIFHSFWLRSAITCGIPFTLLMIYFFLKNVLSNKSSIYVQCFGILIIIQGFSLALFHISLIGMPLFLFFLSVHFCEREVERDKIS